jgi:hypothetical protein
MKEDLKQLLAKAEADKFTIYASSLMKEEEKSSEIKVPKKDILVLMMSL